ncbi:unnamed protein product [Nezara viridula]|uniref:Uncharacterized protein n=1 Tax=Nezara viridula TaxID=85310 RepID=A0A9P0MLW8_NEZVI|nr:unnamed protein product [Nezara viridula]
MEVTNNSGSIKAIDKTTVHRICSGQVVLNLATAVKELIENSLDAGATVIDVKLKEYGSEIIEVVDNGAGVHPSNFEGLTLKHHTSKLRDFSDLISVETFGFRGEALSSLCALSELSVVTRHESENCGTALTFDRNGHIIDQKQHARQIGTTVTLTNLFSALPVRQKEFHKNLKREFNKMTQLLSAYCLVSTGVKISCVNQTKSSRTTFLSTQGCKTVKENISCLFGAKQLSSLLEIKQTLPNDEILAELQVSEEDFCDFTLEGYISSCAHGSGRGSNDRQFYFINSRPCEPQKITKQVNEVYHQFNSHQYPFVFLNINVTKGSVDINVTPDKRKVFLTEEKLLLALIKASILHLFEKIPSTFSYNNVSICRNEPPKNSEGSRPNFNKFDFWRHKSDGKRKSDCLEEKFPKKQSKIEVKNTSLIERFCVPEKKEKLDDSENVIKENGSTEQCYGFIQNNHIDAEHNSDILQNKNFDITENNTNIFQNSNSEQTTIELTISKKDEQSQEICDKISVDENLSIVEEVSEVKEIITSLEETLPGRSKLSVEESVESKSISYSSSEDIEEQKRVQSSENSETSDEKTTDNLVPIEFDEFEERGVKSIFSSFDFDSIKKSFCERLNKSHHEEAAPTVRFRAVIDPSKNQQAEKELSKEISKEMFKKMEIIGQFNLGFIIAKLDSDLFIIDQHATDEKYNFETLQQTTVISNQKLVSPQLLELTAANEFVVMENMNIFNKNGFEFHVDETAIEFPCTQSVQSKILRKIFNAPYFVTNKIIYNDLNVPYVSDLAQSRYQSFHNKLQNHPNPLVSNLASSSIPDNPPRQGSQPSGFASVTNLPSNPTEQPVATCSIAHRKSTRWHGATGGMDDSHPGQCPFAKQSSLPLPPPEVRTQSLRTSVDRITNSNLNIFRNLDKRLSWNFHTRLKRLETARRFRLLQHLPDKRSKLSINYKRLIYMTIIRPIWTYGIELWGSTKPSNSSRIQSLQFKILRKILNAPYFVTNKIIHKDLNVPYVSDLAQSRYLSFHNKLQNHPNPLVSNLASSSIPDNPPRRQPWGKLPAFESQSHVRFPRLQEVRHDRDGSQPEGHEEACRQHGHHRTTMGSQRDITHKDRRHFSFIACDIPPS